MSNEIKYGIPILVAGLGAGLPLAVLKVFGSRVTYDVDGIYSSLLIMFGFSIYYWGKKFAPLKLKSMVTYACFWSAKSLAYMTIFVFFIFLVLGILSTFAIVATSNWDNWLRITLGLLFCAVSGYAFLGVLIFERMDDNSGI